MGPNAIKSTLFYVILFLIGCKTKQIDNENYIDSYYFIIHQIISKDSIRTYRKIDKIKNSSEYDEKSKLHLKQYNSRLKLIIEKEFINFTKYIPLRDYFGDEKLRIALKDFPSVKMLTKSKIDASLEIINDKIPFGHIFSAPLIIGNKMIVYHSKNSGKYNMFYSVYIYDISNFKNPKLIKIVHNTIT